MRCYNGCPDSQLKAYLDSLTDADNRLKGAHPKATCTWFPNGEFYQVFIDHKIFGGEYKDKIRCCNEAIRALNTQHSK